MATPSSGAGSVDGAIAQLAEMTEKVMKQSVDMALKTTPQKNTTQIANKS